MAKRAECAANDYALTRRGFIPLGLKLHAEVIIFAEGEDEGGEEGDHFLHVGEVGHLDDAVHVAEREGDEGAGDAVARRRR